jgi:prophage regulatory protein
MKPTKANTPLEFASLPDDALIRLAMLITLALIPFSSTTLWRRVRQGTFPQPVRISSQVTAWRCGDIRQWLLDPAGYQCPSKPICGAKTPRGERA